MLVIIPGWMHAAVTWSEVSKQLTKQQVDHVVLDIPGFGTVPTDPTLQTIADLSDWCLREINMIQHNSDTPLVLFGHSCGGRVALKLTSDGLTVSQLILYGSPNLYRPTLGVMFKKMLVRILSPIKFLIPESWRVKLRAEDFSVARGSTIEVLYKSVVQDDQTSILPLVSTTTRLLWGENDAAAPVRIGIELEQKLPNAVLEILPNLGHNLHYENPTLLAGKISKLLHHE